MDWYRVAKILEVSGVLIGTGLGTILLNPEVVGKLAHRINKEFLRLGDTLTKRYTTIMSPILQKDMLDLLSKNLAPSMIAFIALICLLIGLIKEIPPLLWIGAFVASGYVLLAIVDTFLRSLKKFKAHVLWLYPVLLILRLVSGFIIVPTVAWALWFLSILVAAIVIGFNAVARKDIVRRGLIAFGFILVFVGLIIELIAT
jgi:hypothetical protein